MYPWLDNLKVVHRSNQRVLKIQNYDQFIMILVGLEWSLKARAMFNRLIRHPPKCFKLNTPLETV